MATARRLATRLRSFGYVEGQNLELVNRYVEGKTAKYPSFAAELVGLPVDVIVTWGTPPKGEC
jgi:hypothetical protein